MKTCSVCNEVRSFGQEAEVEVVLGEIHSIIVKAFVCLDCILTVRRLSSSVDIQADRRGTFEEFFFPTAIIRLR